MLRFFRLRQRFGRSCVWAAGDLLSEEITSNRADSQDCIMLALRAHGMPSLQLYQHTKRHQPWRTASRLLRLSVSSEPRLLRLISLQPLRRALIQLALERFLLFLLSIRGIASSSAQLLHGSAIARELSAENAAWGRGERHGRVCLNFEN